MPNISVFPILFAIPDIRRLQSLPFYMPKTFLQPIRVLDFLYSCPTPLTPLDLTKPGREQWHHRPMRQLWSLPNARPFVARDAEEQAVRYHYR